jgi:hypothetical protein
MSEAARSPRRQARTNRATRHQNCRAIRNAAKKTALGHLWRYVMIVMEAVLGSLLVTACGPGTSVPAEVQQLIQQNPWLSRLALAFLEGLTQELGWNFGLILRAAALALLVGE